MWALMFWVVGKHKGALLHEKPRPPATVRSTLAIDCVNACLFFLFISRAVGARVLGAVCWRAWLVPPAAATLIAWCCCRGPRSAHGTSISTVCCSRSCRCRRRTGQEARPRPQRRAPHGTRAACMWASVTICHFLIPFQFQSCRMFACLVYNIHVLPSHYQTLGNYTFYKYPFG